MVHLRKDGLHRPHCHSFHCILYPDTPTFPQIPLACSSMPRLLHSNQARTPQTPAAPSFVRTYPTPAIIFSKHGLISFPPLSRRFNSIQRLLHFHYTSTRKDMKLLLPSPFLTRGLAAFRNSLFFFHACCVFHNSFHNHYRRAAVSAQLKSKVGLALVKTAVLRITLNLDGTPITSKSHTHPSHSKAYYQA